MRARESLGDPSAIEIIVVDNDSTDDTESIARSYGARIVREEERRIASARNRGAEAARGEIVGFLDADSTITTNMFNSIDAAMSSGDYIGGGTMIRFERCSPGLFCTYCITVIPARWLFGVMGGLLFTEKSTFEAMGGFDRTLYCAEDTKFAFELKAFGRKVAKRFKIITGDHVTTSTRAFDRLGDWYYFRNLPAIISQGGMRAFKDREFCWRFWYDVDR